MDLKNKKALVALSGGVDSSVASAIAKEMGCDCVAVMLKLHRAFDENDTSCGTAKDAEDAKKIAESLNIPFSVLSCEDSFESDVIERFVCAYEKGCTPNPCIECNRYMKFGKLFEHADANDCEYVITGHYARTEYDDKYGRIVLKRAADEQKDQSYVLYSLTPDKLGRVMFPLGSMQKSEARELAAKLGFINAHKKESQDICFIPDGDYVSFIERYRDKKFECGNFIDSEHNVLGVHKGIIKYTIGQHKKLGIVTPEPMYVSKIDPETNEIMLVLDEDLYKAEVKVADLVWSAFDTPPKEFRAYAKLRYRHKAAPCTVIVEGNGSVTLFFDEKQRAPARGQSAVIYDGDTVLGGGIIQ